MRERKPQRRNELSLKRLGNNGGRAAALPSVPAAICIALCPPSAHAAVFFPTEGGCVLSSDGGALARPGSRERPAAIFRMGKKSVSVSILASALPTACRRLHWNGEGGSWGGGRGPGDACCLLGHVVGGGGSAPHLGWWGWGAASLCARLFSCAGGFSPGAVGRGLCLPSPPHPPSPVAQLDARRGAEAAGNTGGPLQAQDGAATRGWCCRTGDVCPTARSHG